MSQDWELLALNFESFSTDDLANETLEALDFHISTTRYLEEGFLRFINITDLELTIKLAMINNFGQVVMNFKEKVVKKKNKYTTKKKMQLAKLCALVRSFLFSYLKSSPFLLL